MNAKSPAVFPVIHYLDADTTLSEIHVARSEHHVDPAKLCALIGQIRVTAQP